MKSRNLEKRMAEAYVSGDFARLEELAGHYIRSYYTSVVAVDKISRNRGAKTPGIDGAVLRTEADKRNVVQAVRNPTMYQAQALRRVYIPKDGCKTRALGIPVQADKGMQQKVAGAVIQICESQADENSFGFRPGRRAQDAVRKCETYLQNHELAYVFDADIESCFDRIDHQFMVDHFPIQSFRQLIEAWLEAGYMEDGVWHETESGTPQGGVISPVLANLALDGLQPLLMSRFPESRFVRYADDMVVFCEFEAELYLIQEVVEEFLALRGLKLSKAKTALKPVSHGFDFLGVRIQRAGSDVTLTPSPKSLSRLLKKADGLLQQSNSVSRLVHAVHEHVRDWSVYHEGWLSTESSEAIWQEVDALIHSWQESKGVVGADALTLPWRRGRS